MSSSQTESALAADVRVTDEVIEVSLADGRALAVPLDRYPRLRRGSPSERANWRLIADGSGIHWPDLDEDISVEGLLAGRRSGEGARSLERWLADRSRTG